MTCKKQSIILFGISQFCETGDQSYSDTSPYKLSDSPHFEWLISISLKPHLKALFQVMLKVHLLHLIKIISELSALATSFVTDQT